MYCNKCGQELSEQAKFCAGCGSTVNMTQAPTKAAQPVKIDMPVHNEKTSAANTTGFLVKHSLGIDILIDIFMLVFAMLSMLFVSETMIFAWIIMAVFIAGFFYIKRKIAKAYSGDAVYCRKCKKVTPHDNGVCKKCLSAHARIMRTKGRLMTITSAAIAVCFIIDAIIGDANLTLLPILLCIGVILYDLSHIAWQFFIFLKYAAFIFTLIPMSAYESVFNNDGDLVKDLFVFFSLLLLFIFSIALTIGEKLNQRNEKRYCNKCKKFTRHNFYGVCSACYFDKSVVVGAGMGAAFFSLAVFIFQFFKNMNNNDTTVYWIITLTMLISVVYKIYMYPAIMARKTEQAAAAAIYWLNLLFGVTGIMWLVLLIWGSSGRGFGTSKVNVDVSGIPINNTQPVQTPAQPAPVEKSMVDKFEELKKLHGMGMLSDEEFEEKRKEFISRL